MGKDFIPIKQNGLSLEKAYKKLFSNKWEITEATEEKYFYRIPQLREIEEIEIGSLGTKETILRLDNNGYIVINKTIDVKALKC